MKTIGLDFDQEAKVSLRFFEKNHYEKLFHVTKNGLDYTWPDVTEVILLVKKDLGAIPAMELKLSTGDIELSPGYMKLKLPAAKTSIEPGTYKTVLLLIVFNGTKDRIWWHGGECEVKKRGI